MPLRQFSIAFATTAMFLFAPPVSAVERNLAPIVDWVTHSSDSREIAVDPTTINFLHLSDGRNTKYVATGIMLGSELTEQQLSFGVLNLQRGRAILVSHRLGSQLIAWHVAEDGHRIATALVDLAVKSITEISNDQFSAEYERTLETFFDKSSSSNAK